MKKIISYIQSHFLLRNILLALCFVIVFTFFISLMLSIFTRHGQKLVVPNFVEMNIDQAEKEAKNVGLEIVVSDSIYLPKGKPGTVLDQNPKAESGVKSGRKVFLTINSTRPKTDNIPYVVGFSLRQAKNILVSKGFEVERLVYVSDMATNNVLSQSWNGRTILKGSAVEAELGSGIVLNVGRSGGAPLPIIPKVMGLTLREAKSRLWEIGFNIGEIRYDDDNISFDEKDRAKVYKQTPMQESRNDFGAKVSLWLTTDNMKLNASSKSADNASREEIKYDSTQVDENVMLEALGIE